MRAKVTRLRKDGKPIVKDADLKPISGATISLGQDGIACLGVGDRIVDSLVRAKVDMIGKSGLRISGFEERVGPHSKQIFVYQEWWCEIEGVSQ